MATTGKSPGSDAGAAAPAAVAGSGSEDRLQAVLDAWREFDIAEQLSALVRSHPLFLLGGVVCYCVVFVCGWQPSARWHLSSHSGCVFCRC